MPDVAAVLIGLTLAAAIAIVAFVVGRRREDADRARITEMIEGNRAASRPGMANRDDSLLRRAEDRARANRDESLLRRADERARARNAP